MGEDFRSWWLLRREFMEKKGGEVGMSWRMEVEEGEKRHQCAGVRGRGGS